MGLGLTDLAANLSANAAATVHSFDPAQPNLATLQVALVMMSLSLNTLIQSVREDETAAQQAAQARGPAEGITP